MNDQAAKLIVDDVRVSYTSKEHDTVAVDNLSLHVKEGEFVSLVGPSGCGKSTLLKVICGLLRPEKGSVILDDQLIDGVPDSVGFVFQNDALLPWETILNNVRLPLAVKKRKKNVQLEQAKQFIELVGLKGFEHYYPKQLSGGMRKRVALACAFAYNPELYLMDEPFGPLDAQTRVKIGDAFLKMWEKVGKSVLFVTHDIEEAIVLSDRVLVMSKRPGRVIAEFSVNLGRPRPYYESRFNENFKALQKKIWQIIASEK